MAIIYLLTRIKRRFIFFYLFRFRVLYRQTGSPGPVRLGFPSLTGGTPHCAKNFTLRFRQTPPVGRSENLTGPSFLLQWSFGIKPCISRQS